MRFLFISGCEGDTQRYRCHNAAQQLRLLGHTAHVYWQSEPAVLEAARAADLIVFHRPAENHFTNAVVQAAYGRPLVYETDDLIFDTSLVEQVPIIKENTGSFADFWRNYVYGNARILAHCHAALTSTAPLAERLATDGRRAWVHRNALSDELLALSKRAEAEQRTDRPLTIGYFSGTFSHDHDFALVAPVLARILGRHGAVRLLLGGCLNLPPELQPFMSQIEVAPFVPWRELPEIMAQSDILLAPLNLDSPFARCRSELKYLEAGAIGIPMIASAVPAFVEAIRQGETGLIATTADEWETCLERLLGDRQLRTTMGAAAAEHVRAEYTFHAQAPRLEAALQEIINAHAHAQPALAQGATQSVWHAPTTIDAPAMPDLPRIQQQWQADSRLHKQSIYMLTGCEAGNSGTYRCRHRQQQLAYHDLRSVVTSQAIEGFDLAAAATHDIGIIHRAILDDLLNVYINTMKATGRPVIFDTDDLVFRPELIGRVDAIKDWPDSEKAIYRQGTEGYRRTLLACDAAIVSTEPLAQMVRELGQRAFVVRNALSWQQIERGAPLADSRLQRPPPAADDPVIIGYFSGTATHNRDFKEAEPALLQLLAEAPHVRLRIVGPLEIDPAFAQFAERIERRELVPLSELVMEVAAVDVALAPLELDNPYCQAKSEVKYMEAATVAVPVIASATEAFQVAITNGVNGMLATTTSDWLSALRLLVADPARRQALGTAARADMLCRYTPAARSRELLDVLALLWDEKQAARESVSVNQVVAQSLALYQQLYWQSPQPNTALEEELRRSREETRALHQMLEQVANGRVMRLLNTVNGWRRKR